MPLWRSGDIAVKWAPRFTIKRATDGEFIAKVLASGEVVVAEDEIVSEFLGVTRGALISEAQG